MVKTALKKIGEFIPRTVTSEQAKDTGMAMTLICLLIVVLGRRPSFAVWAAVLLLINMIWSDAFRPLAKGWFGLSRLLGTFVSKVIFSIIFIVLVIPVGLLRRWLGKDPLQIKKWKRGSESVFKVRDHEYTSSDIVHPY
jgi:hypothetical protein